MIPYVNESSPECVSGYKFRPDRSRGTIFGSILNLVVPAGFIYSPVGTMSRETLLAIVCLAAGSLLVSAKSSEASSKSDCRICSVKLMEDMPRAEVEMKVAAALGTMSNYSLYGNNLLGGVVLYRDKAWTLKVIYKPGAPAPWVATESGSAEHLAAVDEAVLSHELLLEEHQDP
jgi:hypothetical protein